MNNKTAHSLSALLIGREERLLWFLPPLLSRGGFTVDLLTSSKIMRNSRFVRDCEIIPHHVSIVERAVEKCRSHYDWIIITEDGILSEIVHSDLSLKDKLSLLPVMREEHFSHIHSKIGLSKLFSLKGIKTPPYRVAANMEDALSGADALGYPVLLKIDSSGGGAGVYECRDRMQIKELEPSIWHKPILVQKKIEGIDLDLSALYLEGELIHFSYSKMEKVISNKFGPSSLRSYRPLAYVENGIFDELKSIGKALGADGFTNITSIEALDGSGRWYIEADMRPNVWVDAPLFFGEDIGERILNWHLKKETLHYPIKVSQNHPAEVKIPYFLRLHPLELLINRYNVWKFIPRHDGLLTLKLLHHKLKSGLPQIAWKQWIKRLTPKKSHKFLKKIYTSRLKN